LKLKEKFLKTVEELNRLLGIVVEEPVAKNVEADVQEVVTSEEECRTEAAVAAEAQEEPLGGDQTAEAEGVSEGSEASGHDAQQEEDVLKSAQLSTLLDSVVKTAEKVSEVSRQFSEVAQVLNEREKIIVTNLTKSISVLCESVDALADTVADLKSRLERIEREPVKKSVTVVEKFQEEVKKSVDLRDIGNKLFELVLQGQVPMEELARFDAMKSLDVLSDQTKKLLNL